MSPTALIVVDHGSRRDEANQLLHTVVEQLQTLAASRFVAVEAAHMELAEPSLPAAFARCVEAGATHIVVCLFFLSPGRHASNDIPRMTEELVQLHPGVQASVTTPLAPDLRLAEILLDRALESLSPSK